MTTPSFSYPSSVTPLERRIARRVFVRSHHRLVRPVLILVTGLPGSGKNALARYVALKYNLAHLSFENVIHQFLQHGGDRHLLLTRARETVYELVTHELLHAHGIVFEGLFATHQERTEFLSRVPAATQAFTICATCPDDVALKRLTRREQHSYAGLNMKQHATPDEYRRLSAHFELPDPVVEPTTCVVNTTAPNIDRQLILIDDYFRQDHLSPST